MHANLYPALRKACQKYPLLQLVYPCPATTPPRPPPPPRACAPPRLPPRCRRRLLSDSDSEETEDSSPTPHKTDECGLWTTTNQGQTITVTTQSGLGSRVTVTVHLSST
ncbi:E4 protein [human papillomavirus 114]|uniref:E4 protein n=1 Tax=human papillomavirus 114 TaxID=735496 RepID=D3VWC0_9PAPI|nr:E4 protein [human papillomavirus 114]